MKAAYDAHLSAYNREVESANRQGNIAREAYERLERERTNLQTAQDEINALILQLNALAWSDQTDTSQYNEDAEKKFTAGDCVKTDGGAVITINIYQFKDDQDLALKLAHEMGHALNLNHVSNPKSVMYYLIKDQDARELALSQEDRAVLKAECRL
jgi:predicted Zn-dependent protease